jgi:hypothetical protein
VTIKTQNDIGASSLAERRIHERRETKWLRNPKRLRRFAPGKPGLTKPIPKPPRNACARIWKFLKKSLHPSSNQEFAFFLHRETRSYTRYCRGLWKQHPDPHEPKTNAPADGPVVLDVLTMAGPDMKSQSSSTTKLRRWRHSPPATTGAVCPNTGANCLFQALRNRDNAPETILQRAAHHCDHHDITSWWFLSFLTKKWAQKCP